MNGVNNSVFVNDKCFQLFNQPLSWPEAQEFCSNYLSGGSLAEPVTPEEKNLAIQLVRSSSTGAWLGANNIISGSFVWSISQQRLSTLDNWWYIGEPNSYGSLKSCVQLAPTTGQIYDSHCIDKLLPMCQYAKDRETPINPCYPLKGAIYTNGTCLQLINVSKTWTDAQTSCSSVHPKAKLFEMFTEQERIEVTHYVQELGVSICKYLGIETLEVTHYVQKLGVSICKYILGLKH
ncbi:C-type lectin TsL-like [Biomphalaria glabrata]|uniref:C-type lectin TsL-like n=1 Tax=Biomphalaria glabrata TaxID=6526 RepID=A0A9W2YXZ8_BIOGL|nr:C-type lectin TsL-like [Biomphalaria glabrata]